jgi:Domain of unknown function (DUF4291)
MNTTDQRLIRAAFTDEAITVYQAYAPPIAIPAVRAGTFVPPFSMERMTWIKPSFGWMMHRSGWAGKPGQEHVLAIDLDRAGFEWALAHSCLSHFTPGAHDSPQEWEAVKARSPVRVQWDPDRSLTGERLPYRAIQIGLSGPAVHRYVTEWIRSIRDITPVVRHAGQLAPGGRPGQIGQKIPAERVYPLSPALARRIGAGTSGDPADPGVIHAGQDRAS